jgi:hypothetical protein
VRAVGVVLDSPVGDEDLGLEECVELLDGQQLVAYAAAVGLDPRVLPGRAGLDVAGATAAEAAPVAQRVGGQLRPVVAADEGGVTPSLPDDLVETGDRGVGVDGVVDEISEGLAGELIDDVQDLDHPPGGGDIELVVQRPHVIRPGGPEPVGRCRGVAQALAVAALGRHPQALLTPQTLDLLAVHHVALPAQHGVRSPVAPSRMAGSEAPQPHAQITVGVCLDR